MKNKIFITTAIDYTNDVIHIGHAYEKVLSDVIARYSRQIKGTDNVHFLTGTDEHGTKNQKAAETLNIEPSAFVAGISRKDKEQIDALKVSYDRFIRTTDVDHIDLSSKIFLKAYENGDIYKGKYEGFYCDGCESYKTLSELDENENCPFHPNLKIQKLNEENYFFKWTKYADFLKELITSNKLIVKPEGKRAEMLAFLEHGLKDVTVSRPKHKVSWGITTPIDDNQVIYVWFDALINYLTEGLATGFWDDSTEIVHFVGKDIARWHVLLWPAMLKSAGYRIPDGVYVHGFVNLEGQKISKSLGNVVRPTDLVNAYGSDAVRYYLLKSGPVVEDSDLSINNLKEVYNSDLANGIGNTVARIAKLAQNSGQEFEVAPLPDDIWTSDVFEPLKNYRVDLVLNNLILKLGEIDKHLNETEPWKITDSVKLKEALQPAIDKLRIIAVLYEPFIPDAAQKIQKQFFENHIKTVENLFPRIK